MTIETIQNSDIEYYLISHDKHGQECLDDPNGPDGQLSKLIRDVIADQPITDVFFMSHGWKGDVPAAKEQYNNWISAMLLCTADREKTRTLRPNFNPLLIGLHWPSLPWGDENLTSGTPSFNATGSPIDSWIDDAADKTTDTKRARDTLRAIFTVSAENIASAKLQPEVVEAYQALHNEIGLSNKGPGASPGADVEQFDPQEIYEQAREAERISFGDGILGGGLSILRQLSFWTMKVRACTFGEAGAATLLRELQQTAGDRDIRFHLMGHSFGCIVISAALAGAGDNTSLIKPVDSVFLVQGALSLWSYCADIPVAQGKSGYFHTVPRDNRIAGSFVTTQSEHDTANGRLYPLGAGLKRQIVYDSSFSDDRRFPNYGALGSFGVRGDGLDVIDQFMLTADGRYDFAKGKIYNLESSEFISEGGGFSGAHSDIAKPAVAHAFWEAVMASY